MKVGFLSLPLAGHLNPMIALARKLQSRGNGVVFFGVPDAEAAIRAAHLAFVPYCEKAFPMGSMAQLHGPVAKLRGEDVLRYHASQIAPVFLQAALETLPKKLEATGIQATVIDYGHSLIQIVPMSLGLPFVQIFNSLHLDQSGVTPVCLFGGLQETTPEARIRNIEGLKKLASYYGPVIAVAKSYADRVGLKIDWTDSTATMSKLAVITQTPREFDYPGIPWPTQFHYTGPFHDQQGRQPASFPWEELTGQPLIYASLGTLVNAQNQVFIKILQAVGRLPGFQVVFSVGKNVRRDDLGEIPSNTILVDTAPQLELLKRAQLCITHAGLNTTLEALGQGVPLVAIPIGYDQPGIAARIAHHGVGEFMNVDDLTVDGLWGLIQKVTTTPSYRAKALYFRSVIAETHGLDVAADVIEQVFQETHAADSDGKGIALSRA
jgi:zeaxanthin glucosyltransferase